MNTKHEHSPAPGSLYLSITSLSKDRDNWIYRIHGEDGGEPFQLATLNSSTHRLLDLKATGNLLAAAPEMLEALECVIPDLDKLPPRVAQIIHDAIAKARGQA